MFVTNQPAMHIEDYLIISDLHLGITREFFMSGFSLPSQVKLLSKKLSLLKKVTKAKNLAIVGDVKHNIPNISWQEMKEVPELLSSLDFKKIVLVKGNHDGNIERIVKGINNVSVRKSLVIGDYFLTHGHRRIKTKKKNIIIGHNHPGVRMRDKIGTHYTMQCWVTGEIKLEEYHKLILMPAFNPLSGCSLVNSYEFIGPLAKRLSKSADVYLLDGTYLGKITDLEIK